MSNWGFWEWLTYTCIAIAAIVLAADAAIKGASNMLSGFSGVLKSPVWNFTPLVLIAVSAFLILATQLGWIGRTAPAQSLAADAPRVVPIERIVGQTFDSVRISVDNKWFVDCTFRNVTLVWEGGFFQWQGSHFTGTTNLFSHNPDIVGTVDILKGLGFLSHDFAASWKHYPPGQDL